VIPENGDYLIERKIREIGRKRYNEEISGALLGPDGNFYDVS
jgi:hypothetical protein